MYGPILDWGIDGWQDVKDTPTHDTGLGLHVVSLPSRHLRSGQCIDFTFRRANSEWADQDWCIAVVDMQKGASRKSAQINNAT